MSRDDVAEVGCAVFVLALFAVIVYCGVVAIKAYSVAYDKDYMVKHKNGTVLRADDYHHTWDGVTRFVDEEGRLWIWNTDDVVEIKEIR
ncbi:MAG: hypothetical protein JRL30_01215 [Deltaproteobacteria bacterium]|nr:hypothetical protein [Deltaproteobacteria bacterium]